MDKEAERILDKEARRFTWKVGDVEFDPPLEKNKPEPLPKKERDLILKGIKRDGR